MPQFAATERPKRSGKISDCAAAEIQSPEEVRRPDDGQVFSVHVGDRTEGGQAGKVPHEVLQRPADVKRNPRV